VRIIRYLVLGLLGVVIAAFTLLNSQAVTINIFLTTVTLPLPLLLCFSLLIGILLGAFVGLLMYWKARQQYTHRLRRQARTNIGANG
jgi:uncharacterized integral membrane protein